jgi:hypothetical protein
MVALPALVGPGEGDDDAVAVLVDAVELEVAVA